MHCNRINKTAYNHNVLAFINSEAAGKRILPVSGYFDNPVPKHHSPR